MPRIKKQPEKTIVDVIIDTREQTALTFPSDPWYTFAIHKQALKTGDYSIKGFETAFTIERKASTSEIANNLFEDRFQDELQRLITIPYKFLLCEFTLRDVLSFPINSGIPKWRWKGLKLNGNFIHKKLVELQIDYGIHVVYAGDHAAESAAVIIKKIHKDLHG
jgi:ERCC4-type nuclease